ncbi:MAG: hypothetical protein M1818_002269 [Claussenomyces sp. TS43310]|nr:MAG: hypothetical protein M1818_002269 [Claussenomyces sp. TS43310]
MDSDAATFHSAQAGPQQDQERTHTLVSVNAPRKDSGYEDADQRRSMSISSSRQPRRPSSTDRPKSSLQSNRQPVMLPSKQEVAEPETAPAPPPPPPATVHYWTSVESRRLEYATIDAASRGIRGFLNRLLPDCIVPAACRRTKFCNDNEQDDDAGSVRRYRLSLPEEKGTHVNDRNDKNAATKTGRFRVLRRFLSCKKS